MQSTDSGGELRQQHNTSSSTTKTNSAKTGISETTTSFTSANTSYSTALNNDTPSKNPFKQQLSQRQQHQQQHEQNGNSDNAHNVERGILGVGAATSPPPSANIHKMTSPSGISSDNKGTAGDNGPPVPPPDHYRQEDPRAAGSWAAFKNWMIGWRGSRRLVLVIVAIALLLDNMLLTTVVPIIPEFLYDIRHPDAPLDSYPRTPLTIHLPPPPTQCPCLKDGENIPAVEVSTLSPEENETFYREIEERHQELVGETVEVGLLFASKAFVQLLVNPIVGPLTHRPVLWGKSGLSRLNIAVKELKEHICARPYFISDTLAVKTLQKNSIGYSIPMFAGFVIMFVSTIIFAFGRSYLVLFVARALQGIGSSCSSVSGMGMLADRYTDDKERGNAMGIALGGLALGVLIGPPFGGIMYEFIGKSAPFLVLSVLALGDGLLQLFMLQPSIQKAESEPPTLKALISDPYILIAAGSITFANMGIAMLEPSLPLWMVDNMGSSRWEQGVAFLPASISYLVGTNLFGPLGHKIGRWFAACLGLVIIGGCLIMIPMATSITHLIIPNAGLGFAIGMVDSSMMPELGYLVDIRHSAVYGSVYALGDVAFCVGFAVGPALSGTLVKEIGFEWMLFGIAIICFLYAPLLTLLKNPPHREEKKVGTVTQGDVNAVQLTSPATLQDGLVNTAYETERL